MLLLLKLKETVITLSQGNLGIWCCKEETEQRTLPPHYQCWLSSLNTLSSPNTISVVYNLQQLLFLSI